MLKLSSDYSIESELIEVASLFFDSEDDVSIECYFLDVSPYIIVNGEFFHIDNINLPTNKFSRKCKLELYSILSAYTGKTFPWGALTGVRPTKLGYEIASQGTDIALGLEAYKVSPWKAEILKRVIANQNGFVPSLNKVNFYVHIPFCPSRCNYCSFISLPTAHNEGLMADYIEHLTREITIGVDTLIKGGYEVDSVYIGGGTPTALPSELFDRMLSAIPYKNIEYTVEAGRPDTITEQKLDIMLKHNVTRISINPQSFSDKTLQLIGRSHTAEEIKDVYKLAKGKFIINMDLIAGLKGESISDFRHTLNETIELMPENITVHTLARKNGSKIKQDNDDFISNTAQMVDLAYELLTSVGYEPYYLYRQKNMLENLENIGYALNNAVCANNITTMEEFYSVFACGAGAISKRLFEGGRIERLANVRDVRLYMAQFEERIDKKSNFFLLNR